MLAHKNCLARSRESARGDLVEIYSAGKIARRKGHAVISCNHLTINQPRHFAASHIEHLQRHVAVPRQLKTDHRRRVKRVRIVLRQFKAFEALCVRLINRCVDGELLLQKCAGRRELFLQHPLKTGLLPAAHNFREKDMLS